MLIFDSFPSLEAAEAFILEVNVREPELGCTIHLSNAAAQSADPFPWVLEPPIVHVERPSDADDDRIEGAREIGLDPEQGTSSERELELELLVTSYGGTYAGT